MELRHLRYFLAVAETGHMTRAAETLGIQQPPLSLQIKALEKELGVTLFQRHPKGVALTEAGRLFRTEAQRLIDDVAAMTRRMARVARGEVGQLSVGFTSSAAAHRFTPEALRACRRSHPGVVLSLSEDNAADITEAVASARLHCGLIRVPVSRPAGLVFETLLREPVVVAVPRDHALARRPGARKPVALSELRQDPFILVRRPGAPGLYANLLALCEEQGFQAQVLGEVGRMGTSLNLVAAGAGVAVVPASMQGQHPHAVVYLPLLESARLDAPLTLVYREADCAGAVAGFLVIARKTATRLARQGGA
ncbi:MAG: LysR family transcriptional regulator [Ramlibacter sp.]|nr:LysR family transcriptional regulator [Ramlibacter sp.]